MRLIRSMRTLGPPTAVAIAIVVTATRLVGDGGTSGVAEPVAHSVAGTAEGPVAETQEPVSFRQPRPTGQTAAEPVSPPASSGPTESGRPDGSESADDDDLAAAELAALVDSGESDEEHVTTQIEDLDPAVVAELAGLDYVDPSSMNGDYPEVTADTADIAPTGEYADQVLVGHVQPDASETEIYGFDLPPPDDDNLSGHGAEDYADQIALDALTRQAALSGLTPDDEQEIELGDPDAGEDPPVEIGAGIEP